jgi:hypothetical protein
MQQNNMLGRLECGRVRCLQAAVAWCGILCRVHATQQRNCQVADCSTRCIMCLPAVCVAWAAAACLRLLLAAAVVGVYRVCVVTPRAVSCAWLGVWFLCRAQSIVLCSVAVCVIHF